MPVQWNGPAIIARVRQATMRGVVSGTEMLREEALRLIQDTPKTGRIYRRRGVEHQASAPGEPPASDTGRLVQSIRTEYFPDELKGVLQASTAYAAFLEFGTSRMEPRPFMRPAVSNKRADIEKTINDEVADELGKE